MLIVERIRVLESAKASQKEAKPKQDDEPSDETSDKVEKVSLSTRFRAWREDKINQVLQFKSDGSQVVAARSESGKTKGSAEIFREEKSE
eukprot:gene9803-18779_t